MNDEYNFQEIIFYEEKDMEICLTGLKFDFNSHDSDLKEVKKSLKKIGIFDNQDIYRSFNWQCADFKGICVNTVKKNYKIKKIFNYVIFNSN